MKIGSSSSSSSSSSGEEDGDSNWKAAIDSVSTTDYFSSISNGDSTNRIHNDVSEKKHKPQTLKLYQIKAQKILEDFIEKNLVIERVQIPNLDNDQLESEVGIRLFKNAPRGMVDPLEEIQPPRKRPRILPMEDVDEKSKKFKRKLKSVVVEGVDVIGAARDACHKALTRFEARDAVAKTASKREEERVAELKKIRGEKWLPSIAREMQRSK
ncbi:hypothetical protein GIB67_030019 [Kingdonia uniflora]|uniref:Uncharacterized protein n=1 Tax=Kingdonia uniflora TaxID=39325 RepID=A0A7J7MXU7_9MAGN|nr:hypothetical protein GIB67_030019 [Kingdonia uniflora]